MVVTDRVPFVERLARLVRSVIVGPVAVATALTSEPAIPATLVVELPGLAGVTFVLDDDVPVMVVTVFVVVFAVAVVVEVVSTGDTALILTCKTAEGALSLARYSTRLAG
jgi:hypothetical protein